MENAKMLILNNKKDESFKAVLNLKLDSPSIIKFYNMINPNKRLALGVKQGKNVVKVPLNVTQNNCEFLLPKSVDLSQKLFCAVVDVSNAFCPEIVLSGSLNSESENTTIESAFVTKKPEDNSVLYEEEPMEEIEKIIDKNLEEDATSSYYDSCSNCKYRKAFYDGGKCCSNIINTPNNAQNAPNNTHNIIFSNSLNNQNQRNSIQNSKDNELEQQINNTNNSLEFIQENAINSTNFSAQNFSSIKQNYKSEENNFVNKPQENYFAKPSQNLSSFNTNTCLNSRTYDNNFAKHSQDFGIKFGENNNCENNNFSQNKFNHQKQNPINLNSTQIQNANSNSYQNNNDYINSLTQYSSNQVLNNQNNLNSNYIYGSNDFTNQNKKEEQATQNVYTSDDSLSNGNDIEALEQEQNMRNDDIDENQTFYEQIKSQLDNLFNKYPTEETLQQLISNSKWVRVNYDNSENYYVLGLIYDDNYERVEYISYGMPSNDNVNAPDDIKDYAQWLPLENKSSETLGYWIVYQDALTGDTIKVNFV